MFRKEGMVQRLLHNETAYQLQRRLQFDGLNAMVLPVRMYTESPSGAAPLGVQGAAAAPGAGG